MGPFLLSLFVLLGLRPHPELSSAKETKYSGHVANCVTHIMAIHCNVTRFVSPVLPETHPVSFV